MTQAVVTCVVKHKAGHQEKYSLKSSAMTEDDSKRYLLEFIFLGDTNVDFVNDEEAWVINADQFPNPRDRFLQAAFQARDKARDAASERSLNDSTYKLANSFWDDGDHDKAIALLRPILSTSGDKLLSFVADMLGEMIVRPKPKERGRPTKKRPKCADEIGRAYTDIASAKAANMINPFTATLQEVIEKLKEYKVWVRPSRSGGQVEGAPAGCATVSQTIVEQELAKFRKRDAKDSGYMRLIYLWIRAERAGQKEVARSLSEALQAYRRK
jgi:hypothetical protein